MTIGRAPTATPLVTRALRRGELLAIDGVLAVALAVVCGYAALEVPVAPGAGVHEQEWLSWLVGLAIGLPVAVRRRWPLTATGVVLATSTAALLTGVIPDFAGAAPGVALACVLYGVGVGVPRRPSVITAAVCVGVTAASLLVSSTVMQGSPEGTSIALSSLVLLLAWIIGRAARERRAHASRTLMDATDRAVSDERLRIARELHDIVAHNMSLIAVKAAIANHVAEQRPQETRDALRIIQTISRDTLTEMRRMFGALRADAALPSGTTLPADAALAPAPGLADLPTLVRAAVDAGVKVRLTVVPDQAELPGGISLAVYRIVQEAVTNVVKHAGSAACHATVVVEANQVRVEVTDHGAGFHASTGDGHGIIGMRERTALYGGDFSAGPNPRGGFTVTARFPLDAP